MTRLVSLSLLLLSCLATRPATSQVWRLDSGTVARGPLIGLDTATYHSTMNYVSGAKVLLGARADRIAQLERDGQTATQQLAAAESELRRCRAEAKLDAADFHTVVVEGQKLAGKPPALPLLLDGHFYKGVGTGGVLAAAAAVLLKVFVFH